MNNNCTSFISKKLYEDWSDADRSILILNHQWMNSPNVTTEKPVDLIKWEIRYGDICKQIAEEFARNMSEGQWNDD